VDAEAEAVIGTEITCRDLETGEQDSVVITDDYVVVTDGNRYVASTQFFPRSGTVIITIKRRSS
jgi:hypothetical protein